MSLRYHLKGLWRWLHLVRRHGRPRTVLYFYGGIGDQLLCTAVAREFQRREPQTLWFFTQSPELFVGHPDLSAVLPLEVIVPPAGQAPSGPFAPVKLDLSLVPWARLSGGRVHRLFYQGYVNGEDRDVPLREPSIAALCRRAGLTGEISLRPYLPQVGMVRTATRSRPRIAIHSSCLNARYPILNKQWPVENLQRVAQELAPSADLIQLGSPQDPLLPGVQDKRGGPLLSAARELMESDLFVGLVGFLMHLARAVDCPSVVVYGGREPPEITGYACNTNLADRPPCSPCWQYSRCEYERSCLTAITPAMVLTAVRAMLAAPPPRPLPADRFVLTPSEPCD